jgi:hypothetical protein
MNSELWISVGQSATKKQLVADALVLLLLWLAAIAVANRDRFCQLQAYTVLLVSIGAFGLYTHYCAQRRECTVETLRSPYCVDCRSTSRGAIVLGRRVEQVESNYERLHLPAARRHVVVVTWLAWLAYGSIFHEAQHESSEDAFLLQVLHGSGVVAYLRMARVLLLWLVATADVLAATPRHIVAASAVFFVLLFFPSHESTAQALGGEALFMRTSIFVVLCFLSESLQRVLHYVDWIAGYDTNYQTHLSGLLMALGQAAPQKPLTVHSGDQLFIPILDPGVSGRDFSLRVYLVDWRIVIRAAWVLVASDFAVSLALVQAGAILYRYCLAKHTIRALIVRKRNFLRLREFAGDPTRQTLHDSDDATIVLKPDPQTRPHKRPVRKSPRAEPTPTPPPTPPSVVAAPPPLMVEAETPEWISTQRIELSPEQVRVLQKSFGNATEPAADEGQKPKWPSKRTSGLHRI